MPKFTLGTGGRRQQSVVYLPRHLTVDNGSTTGGSAAVAVTIYWSSVIDARRRQTNMRVTIGRMQAGAATARVVRAGRRLPMLIYRSDPPSP